VCDHLSTTFAEALAVNKPTILFWNPETNRLREAARPYYDLLKRGGILFDTPEGAGRAVNQIYDDVETWWNDPERQNTVETFCKRFARNSPDAIELWTAEFKRIAAMPRPKANRIA
jgi:putative transferase (TIGR04331 family)